MNNHLTKDELEWRYLLATNPVEKSHYQIIWLLARGKKTEEVAEVTGYSLRWIRVIAKRYNQDGPSGLGDKREENFGSKPLLDEFQTTQLLQRLQEPPPDGGLWNGRKVADWMSQLLDRQIYAQRGWEYLKAMEFRLRVPRPSHIDGDPVEQELWKKKLHSV